MSIRVSVLNEYAMLPYIIYALTYLDNVLVIIRKATIKMTFGKFKSSWQNGQPGIHALEFSGVITKSDDVRIFRCLDYENAAYLLK